MSLFVSNLEGMRNFLITTKGRDMVHYFFTKVHPLNNIRVKQPCVKHFRPRRALRECRPPQRPSHVSNNKYNFDANLKKMEIVVMATE